MNFLSKFSGIAAILGALLIPNMANAEGFALQDWSARGAALAGGLVARGGDASAVAYNPAAITELEGLQVMVGSEFVIPYSTISGVNDITGQHFSRKGDDALFIIPHGYVTYKMSDKISFGVGMFSRFGLGNEYPETWDGRYNMTYAYLLTSTINPNVAWRVNDNLSLAAGIEISASEVTLEQMVPSDFGDLRSKLKSDLAYAFGFNLAAHYRFNEQWSAGLTYRSAISYDYEGTQDLKMQNGYQVGTYKGETTINLPQEVKLAVAYAPTEELSFEAGVAWYGWSHYNHLNLHYDANGGPGGVAMIPNPKSWNDTWMYSLSVEYAFNEWLDLRAGISYETAAVNQYYAEYIVPSSGRFKYSVGAGFHKDAWALDLAYTFHDVQDTEYDNSWYAPTHNHGVSTNSKADGVFAHAFNMSFSYKF